MLRNVCWDEDEDDKDQGCPYQDGRESYGAEASEDIVRVSPAMGPHPHRGD